VTKAELVKRITVAGGGALTRKGTEDLMDAVFRRIRRALLEEGRFSYPDFGTWTVHRRRARRGFNPQTGEPMKIPGTRAIRFKPSKRVKMAL
jgi:DNA-binding protein HU-beta